ncbi:MAG: GWxTD domain-containing protein [Thermoanaerobaculia bacterium]
MKSRIVACVLFTLYAAAAAFGALSKEYNDFAKGPTEYLLTKEEKKQWKAIATDEQAKAFIDLFWARRDPTPGTPKNEFREAIEKRIAIADSLFTTATLRGAATDRGKVYVLMGPQTAIKRGGPDPGRGVHAEGGAVQGVPPTETWQYELSKTTLPLGQPMFQVAFADQYASNDWTLERLVGNDYPTVFDRIARAYIAQPDLKEVPVFTAGAATIAPLSALKSEALRNAIDAARASHAASDTLFVSYGEFITPAGELFVPVQIYAPKSAGLTTGPVTFFGTVEKSDGGHVIDFEEPATLTASHDDVFYARSLMLPPGSYVGTFGLAREGKVISVVSTPMTVAALDPAAPAVSRLMLSNNVYALADPTHANDPFIFGGIRVVPKSDRAFHTTDDLWYLLEVRNPGLDAGNQPKMSVKLSVTGKTDDGIDVERNAPATLTTVQPVKGAAGRYVIGEPLPLSTFKPGNYTIAVRVKDMTLDRSYDLKETFRIVK